MQGHVAIQSLQRGPAHGPEAIKSSQRAATRCHEAIESFSRCPMSCAHPAKPAWSAYAPNIVRLLEALIASVQSISGAQANGGATSPRHAVESWSVSASWRDASRLYAVGNPASPAPVL